MSNIQKLPTGQYKINYELPRIGGQRRRKSLTLPKGTTLKEAKEIMKKYDSMYSGNYIQHEKTTLAEFFDNVYLTDYTKTLSPTTLNGYISLFNNPKPYALRNYFGNYYLKQIDRLSVQKYVNYVSENVSAKTTKSYCDFLHKLFEVASIAGYFQFANGDSPCDKIVLPHRSHKQDNQAYTSSQIAELLSFAKTTTKPSIDMAIIGLGALAGLRKGEMAALKWKDVHFDSNPAYIDINSNRVSVGSNYYEKAPKSESGYRKIPIPNGLVSILKTLKNEQTEQYLKRERKKPKPEDYVLSNIDGKAYAPDTIYERYNRMLEAMQKQGIDIPKLKLHALRHTYASLLANNGVSSVVLQELMGHADIQQTINIYSHAYNDKKNACAYMLDEAIFKEA